MELGRTVEGGVLHGEETVTQLLGKSGDTLGVVLEIQSACVAAYNPLRR